jgi:hypothetical protein
MEIPVGSVEAMQADQSESGVVVRQSYLMKV